MKKYLLISTISFGAKGVFSLILSFLVINNFSVDMFALWSVFFSLAMLLSISDLGIGQYIVTKIIDNDGSYKPDRLLSMTTQVIISIFILGSILLTLFHDYILQEDAVSFTLLIIVLARILAIPYGAFIQAKGLYHERKLIEAMTYLFALIYVYFAIEYHVESQEIIFTVNLILSVFLLLLIVRAKSLHFPSLTWEMYPLKDYQTVLSRSFPYFANNCSGLIIYGGFIYILSHIVSNEVLAMVSIFHTILFMNLYQCFELIYRTLQVNIKEDEFFIRIVIATILMIGIIVLFFLFFGKQILSLIFLNYDFVLIDLVAFSGYLAVEILFLLFTSKAQIHLNNALIIRNAAFIKLLSFSLSVVCIFSYDNVRTHTIYTGLIISSIVSFLFLLVKLNIIKTNLKMPLK